MCIKALSINQKIMRCTDLETASRIFQEEFGKILENHAPVKVLQTRNHYLPYLSDETKLLMEERNALKEEATKLSDDQLFNEYKRKRNEVKARLEKEEIEFHKNKLHDANLTIKKVWKTVHDLQRSWMMIRLSHLPRLLPMCLTRCFKIKSESSALRPEMLQKLTLLTD